MILYDTVCIWLNHGFSSPVRGNSQVNPQKIGPQPPLRWPKSLTTADQL